MTDKEVLVSMVLTAGVKLKVIEVNAQKRLAQAHSGSLEEAVEAQRARLRLIDLEAGQCRWPVGEDGCSEELFCADPIACEGASYCPQHMTLAYKKAPVFNQTMVRWLCERHRYAWPEAA